MALSFTKIPFIKMQGAGNDFVVLDALDTPLLADLNFEQAAQTLCARHLGIGSDGLLLLVKGDVAPVRMRMWNPDGTEDMCGNGLRCIAKLAYAREHVCNDQFTVETLAGVRTCEVLSTGDVRIEMGMPQFEFSQIPFRPDVPLCTAIEYLLPLNDDFIHHVTTISTGTTHTVIFVEELPGNDLFFRLSPQVENHAWFPERTTVLWTKIHGGSEAEVRIWERGVGETLACGTGACAVAVAAQVTGRRETPLHIHSKGGVLRVVWQPGQSIIMTGPARNVFEGLVHIDPVQLDASLQS